MKCLLLLLSWVCHTTAAGVVGTDEVVVGSLRLEFTSRSFSPSRLLLSDLIRRTSIFLDEALQQYFATTIGDDYFSHTGLTVVDLSVDQSTAPTTVNSQISAGIDFDFSVFFNTQPVPTVDFVVGRVKEAAFAGENKLAYITLLKESKVDFLANITYAVIELNGQTIAAEDVTQTASAIEAIERYNEESQGDQSQSRGRWSAIRLSVIAGSAASGAAVVVIIMLLFCLFCWKGKRRKQSGKSIRTSSCNGSKTDEAQSTRSPSPVHSICSQESSKFTYNPTSKSVRSLGCSTIESKTIPSQVSNLQVEVDPNIDLDAWASRTHTISPVTPDAALFGGGDISTIEAVSRQDLSLIEEGDDEGTDVLTTKNLHSLQDRAFESFRSKRRNRVHKDDEDDSLSDAYTSDGSDVMHDLANASRRRYLREQPLSRV